MLATRANLAFALPHPYRPLGCLEIGLDLGEQIHVDLGIVEQMAKDVEGHGDRRVPEDLRPPEGLHPMILK